MAFDSLRAAVACGPLLVIAARGYLRARSRIAAPTADHAPKGFPVHVGGVYTDPFKHGANLAFIEIGREIEGVMTLLPQRLRDFSGGWHFAFPLFL